MDDDDDDRKSCSFFRTDFSTTFYTWYIYFPYQHFFFFCFILNNFLSHHRLSWMRGEWEWKKSIANAHMEGFIMGIGYFISIKFYIMHINIGICWGTKKKWLSLFSFHLYYTITQKRTHTFAPYIVWRIIIMSLLPVVKTWLWHHLCCFIFSNVRRFSGFGTRILRMKLNVNVSNLVHGVIVVYLFSFQ